MFRPQAVCILRTNGDVALKRTLGPSISGAKGEREAEECARQAEECAR